MTVIALLARPTINKFRRQVQWLILVLTLTLVMVLQTRQSVRRGKVIPNCLNPFKKLLILCRDSCVPILTVIVIDLLIVKTLTLTVVFD